MPRRPEIIHGKTKDGAIEVFLDSWKYFGKFISRDLLDLPGYIFRGHGSSSWNLESSLDRSKKRSQKSFYTNRDHLQAFKRAIRGRRGPNPPNLENENEWWALGQHNGLATPLLDWTRSPFVALFFAFEEEHIEDEYRAVYGVQAVGLENKIKETSKLNGKGRPDSKVEIFSPNTDENPRLVNQSALFIRLPDDKDLESVVREIFKGHETSAVIIKIKIPNKEREECLTNLNKMNINHLTLFPDIYGSAQYSNLALQIPNYDAMAKL